MNLSGRWTGRDIARALTQDTQTCGWVSAVQLTRPTAFLRRRLAQIDWLKSSAAEYARENDRARLAEQATHRRLPRERGALAADAATRAAIT
ncbi:hypothetical protein B2J88_42240 [Rhodococcus sp. SRB_17]|uniref:hypothetical protein n=1 Tax=Rhodococcus sp. OK302 TaxID=1882769 RepID=UPI000B93E027|nr:hypothetical protein [Rhodococcus sp. OK302]NMM90872.1 hypothetical protein [Rhodococcus sp. SRB_17]